jgi:hypothetical protein
MDEDVYDVLGRKFEVVSGPQSAGALGAALTAAVGTPYRRFSRNRSANRKRSVSIATS